MFNAVTTLAPDVAIVKCTVNLKLDNNAHEVKVNTKFTS